MTIHSYVEALLKYAEEYLLLDTLDENYVRQSAYSLLNISEKEVVDVDVENLEEMSSPSLILGKIIDYALKNEIITCQEIDVFKARFMDCFIKRPSEIQEIFMSLASKNAGKAINWLQDYNVKSGYVCDYIKKWEAKSTKGKLEVAFLPKLEESSMCKYCANIEGSQVYRNLRLAPLTIDGEEWNYISARLAKFSGHGYLAQKDHKSLSLNEKTLNIMTKFVDLASGHYAAFKNCDCQKQHGHIIIGDKLLPMMKADCLTKLKSKEYPYIALSILEWYVPVIRMACSTREKLIEFALKIIEKLSLPCAVAVRKQENQYIIELILIGNKAVKEENAGLINGKVNLAALMGSFALSQEVYEDSQKIEKLLTKELNLKTAGNLDKHLRMIQKLMKEVGTTKLSPIEAALDVKEVINNTLESALKDIAVYEVGSQELIVYLEQSFDIKRHI